MTVTTMEGTMALGTGDELLAAFDAGTGALVDLVLSDPDGLWARSRGDWVPLQPADPRLDGAEVVDVDESFVDAYDRAEAARALGSLGREQAQAHAADDGNEAVDG